MDASTAGHAFRFAARAAREVDLPTDIDALERLIVASDIVRWELDGLAARIEAAKVNNTPRPGPVRPVPRPTPKPSGPKPPPSSPKPTKR